MAIDRVARTVVDLVGEHARRTPDAVAFEAAGCSLTYEELYARAIALAAQLRATVKLRDGEDTFVVYEGPRDERFAVAALGVFGAGCCLALVDPEWPQGRRDELKAQLCAVTVLGDEVPGPGGERLRDTDSAGSTAPSLPRGASAYAATTTGTTGAPKIVVTSHGALADSVVQTASTLGLDSNDRVLQFAPLGVDICLEELLTAWAVGGTAIAMAEDAYADFQVFTDFLAAERVTTLNLPATFWLAWLAALRDGHVVGILPALRVVGVGSDVVPAAAIAEWQALGVGGDVYDMYGSTEQAITSAIAGPLDLGAPLSEGRMGAPAGPMSAHVLRADLTEAEVGETGELVMAGPSLASYYAANPRLTAAKFSPSPFGGFGERMYRSGDQAVRLRDGTIRLLGRLDRRVKVRSFSVDLDEVQAVLAAVDGVRAVRVTTRVDGSRETVVVANIEPQHSERPAKDLAARMLSEAARVLPEYALPSEVVVGNERVVGGAGARLPEAGAEAAVLHGAQVAAATLWCEMLGVAEARPDDSFLDLGGHSLLVARFITELRRRCDTVLSRRAFLADPTLRYVLEEVTAQDGLGDAPTAEPLVSSGQTSGLATAGQTAMWLQRRENPRSTSYNVPLVCDLHGALDIAKLERAVNRVISAQPTLRTAVYASKGTLVQEQRERALVVAELRDDPVALADFFDAPFDLAAADVVRVAVGRADGADVVAFAFHHVAIDEASTALFLHFLEQAWRGEDSVPRPTLIDVAQTEAAWKADSQAREVEGVVATLGAPCPVSSPWPDAPGAAADAADWECVVAPFILTDDRMQAVKALARRSGTTLYAVSCALFGITLARFAGQKRVVIGVPVSQRTEDTEHTVGPLLSTLPLVVDLTSNPTIGTVVTQVARGIERLQDWSRVSLADVVNAAGARRLAGRAALVQALVLPEPEAMPSISLGDCRLVPQVTPPRGATMDIFLIPRVWQERWEWDLVYRRAKYSPALIAAFEAMLTTCLDRAGRDPEIRVGEMGAAPAKDRRGGVVQVLDDYGRVLPPGAIGWLHPRVSGLDLEEAASGVARRDWPANGEGVSVNIGLKGRVTYDGKIEVIRGEELTA